MTVSEGTADILLFSASVGVLVFVIYRLRQCRIDAVRHFLFVYRDELFDLALDGHLEFDSPAYVNLRSHINRLLRFTHEFNTTRGLIALRFAKSPAIKELQKVLTDSIDAVQDDKTRERLNDIQRKCAIATSFKALIFTCVLIGWATFKIYKKSQSEELGSPEASRAQLFQQGRMSGATAVGAFAAFM